jgi:hypothetical protein
MADILLHDFERFPEEAAIIGRIIAGYGELEYWWAKCLGRTLMMTIALSGWCSANGTPKESKQLTL